jgi:hypothetical protein
MIAARRTRLRIRFRHQRDPPGTADGFPKMPLQNRAAFAGVREVAAVIAITIRGGEYPITLRAFQHGRQVYHGSLRFSGRLC